MAERPQMAAITVGGKGSSLTSSSIFSVANKLAQVRIDSSILDKLSSSSSSSNNKSSPSLKYHIIFPQFLTLAESRASSTLLLSKLLLSSSPIRANIPNLICQTLNSNLDNESNCLSFDVIDITEDEKCVLDACLDVSILDGVCALLDYGTSCLSLVSETVAALSCEATNAKVLAFNLVDSGDGKCVKDEAGVASDLKILLNGSKLVGKVEVDAVSSIPEIYGSFREAVRLAHSRARVQLNSPAKSGIGGSGKAWEGVLAFLAAQLRNVGVSSLSRVGLNVNGVGNDGLRSSLKCLIDEKCPTTKCLQDAPKLALEAAMEEKYIEFVHIVNELFGLVMTVVSWEMITAIVSLEGSELLVRNQPVAANGPNAKVDKKSQKKKKVSGKGTTVVQQLIRERLQGVIVDGVDELATVQKIVDSLFSFLDPKVPALGAFLEKIKEIVESNESRRLPKLPKVIVSLVLMILFSFLFDILCFLCEAILCLMLVYALIFDSYHLA